jgi:hypothetical protein
MHLVAPIQNIAEAPEIVESIGQLNRLLQPQRAAISSGTYGLKMLMSWESGSQSNDP